MTIDRLKGTRLPKCCILAIVATIFGFTTTDGAQLTIIEGLVQIDHGNGFKPVVGSALALPGDRVRTGTGAAYLVYENNCSEKIGPGQTLVVLAVPPACSLKDGAIESDASILPADAFTAGSLVAFGGGVAAALASSGTGSSVSP